MQMRASWLRRNAFSTFLLRFPWRFLFTVSLSLQETSSLKVILFGQHQGAVRRTLTT